MSDERDITFCSNHQTGKKMRADCTVHIVRTDADMAGLYDTWQVLVGIHVDELVFDTWHVCGEWNGDMWPNQGLPCVTSTMV
jgi:hypothetical protein